MVAELLPLIVFVQGQGVYDLSRIDTKGHNKSLEKNSLWHIHGTTGKLLPYSPEHQLLSITMRQAWCEAHIALTDNPPKQSSVECSGRKPGPPPDSPQKTKRDTMHYAILDELIELIAERRVSMPAGSYTSYLFSEGSEKIRKKVAEEAIELVLAKGIDAIREEAADFLYHFLVMLEAESMDFLSVLSELRHRQART